MKLMKGIMIGTLISAGAIMWYAETNKSTKKMMMKKGKKFLKTMAM